MYFVFASLKKTTKGKKEKKKKERKVANKVICMRLHNSSLKVFLWDLWSNFNFWCEVVIRH